MFSKLQVFAFAALVVGSQAMCPNKCSGHGACAESDKCSCQPNWMGPDCSERQCPYGLSWVTSVDNMNAPAGAALGGHHLYEECSAKGKCMRDSGECECFEGYTGKGCRRQSCPSGCSGHGRCIYNADINSNYLAESAAKFHSQLWDAEKTRQCACDRGWGAVDCSSRLCPKGDDPLTSCTGTQNSQSYDTQRIAISCDSALTEGTISLTFTDMFNGVYTTKPILLALQGDNYDPLSTYDTAAYGAGGYDSDADRIREALQELPNFVIPTVNVSLTTSGSDFSGEQIYYVLFTDVGTSGSQNLLACNVNTNHDDPSAQPRMDSGLDTANGCSCTVDRKPLTGDNEYQEHKTCSDRGICDGSTGECDCFDGHTGEDCSVQTIFF